MTKISKPPSAQSRRGASRPRIAARSESGYWLLRDAKARLSEVVQRAETQPQTLTVHGKPRAVVISTAEYARLQGQRTGKDLVDLLQRADVRDIEFGTSGIRAPVRNVDL